MWCNADSDINGKPVGNTYGDINTNSDSYGSGYSYTYSYGYSCLTHTNMSAWQSIHDKSDRR